MTEFSKSIENAIQTANQAHAAEREAILEVAKEIDQALVDDLLRLEVDLEKPFVHEPAIVFLEQVQPGSTERIKQLAQEKLQESGE